ncbi:hypothetical protein IWX64_001034 [Arthrobacter sp. CAN_A212]|uniref:hypothetical protein n=1 Tax=Arthrobacter sp. CAN_A212 TaxID=2787719 RepID=UPI0018CA9BFE
MNPRVKSSTVIFGVMTVLAWLVAPASWDPREIVVAGLAIAFVLTFVPRSAIFRGSSSAKSSFKEYPKPQRRWLRGVIRQWETTMDDSGLSRPRGIPPKQRKVTPTLMCHTPVPLGIELEIAVIPGLQNVRTLVNAKGNLESAWGRNLRIEQVSPGSAKVTVEFKSPLNETRYSADQSIHHRTDD